MSVFILLIGFLGFLATALCDLGDASPCVMLLLRVFFRLGTALRYRLPLAPASASQSAPAPFGVGRCAPCDIVEATGISRVFCFPPSVLHFQTALVVHLAPFHFLEDRSSTSTRFGHAHAGSSSSARARQKFSSVYSSVRVFTRRAPRSLDFWWSFFFSFFLSCSLG